MPRPNKGPQVRFRKDRNCWGVAQFIQGNLKWLATGCGSQQDAQRELARILIRSDSHTGPSTTDERMVKDVLSSYLLEHGPQTLRPDNLIYACKTLAPFWADLPVCAITKATCQRYATERRAAFKRRQEAANKGRIKSGKEPKPHRELSNASIRLELATLKAALRHDHQEGRLLHVPPVWLPGKPPPRERWLTNREAAKLLRAARNLDIAKQYLPLFILLALYTGARKEAVLSLRWSQIDFHREIIDFRTGGSASSKGRAIVPIPRRLLRELRKAKLQGTDLGYVVHLKETVIKGGVAEVIHQRLGDIKKGFKEACRREGLKGVTPHTLRHTAASWMVQKGVPLFDVARYLGHTSTIMVEKTYGHMEPEHLSRAKESWG